MAHTETLRPDATGDENSIELQLPADSFPATDHWNKVDEASADDYVTKVYIYTTGSYFRDLYNLPASAIPSGSTINSITIYFRCDNYYDVGNAYAKPSLKSNSTVTDGTEVNLTQGYVTYSQTWTTNPADSAAWEKADIDALQIGVSLKLDSSDDYPSCTQVYVVVDYTVAYTESASVIVGNLVSASCIVAFGRDSSVIIGNLVSASKVRAMTKSASVVIGNLVSASKIRAMTKTASVIVGNLVSASRMVAFKRVASVLIGNLVSASKIRAMTKTASVIIGNLVSASKIQGFVKSSSTIIGIVVSASRAVTFSRASSVIIGVKTTASRLVGWFRSSSKGLYEYYNTGDDGSATVQGINWYAQTFTPSVAHKITSVKLKLYRTGSPGEITLSIRATSGNHPTGADLCSGTTDGDTLTTDTAGEWREITLGAGYDLVAGTKYAIVVRVLTGDIDNKAHWRWDATSPSYTRGNLELSLNSGSSWTSYTGHDLMFEEYGEKPITIGVTASATKVWAAVRTATVLIGVVVTASFRWAFIHLTLPIRSLALTVQHRSLSLTSKVRSLAMTLLRRQ